MLTYRYNLNGAVAVTGTASQPVPRMQLLTGGDEAPISCSDVDGRDIFTTSESVGGHAVYVVVGLDNGGTGPGTRSTDPNGGGVEIDNSVEDTNFNDPGSVITIGADGSGSLTLVGWVSPTNKVESGSITWSCSQ